MLEEMAEHQRRGRRSRPSRWPSSTRPSSSSRAAAAPPAPRLVRELFFGANPIEFAPTIADVHTQPTDEGGNPVGRVLHVGTGYARLMVVTADTCTGPRAYAGLVSSYYEEVTETGSASTTRPGRSASSPAEPRPPTSPGCPA